MIGACKELWEGGDNLEFLSTQSLLPFLQPIASIFCTEGTQFTIRFLVVGYLLHL